MRNETVPASGGSGPSDEAAEQNRTDGGRGDGLRRFPSLPPLLTLLAIAGAAILEIAFFGSARAKAGVSEHTGDAARAVGRPAMESVRPSLAMMTRELAGLMRQAWSVVATPIQVDANLEWHDAQTLTLEGLGFDDRKSPFNRLPARAEAVVRPAVWNLSRDTAGVVVRFATDATAISARWELVHTRLSFPIMTAVAASGLDLYTRSQPVQWRWVGIGQPTRTPFNIEPLASSLTPGWREYLLYLPLRNGIEKLEIGVPRGSRVQRGAARPEGRKPIAFYGTSITHGASASRAGMTHVAIVGRRLDREVINLGFSGNGKMETSVVRYLAEIDASVYVLDCAPNLTPDEIRQRTMECVRLLRGARPLTPILLVEDRTYADASVNEARRQLNRANRMAMREVYASLLRERMPGIYYLEGARLLADDVHGEDGEATIDGSHLTDLGFVRQASSFEVVLRRILGEGDPDRDLVTSTRPPGSPGTARLSHRKRNVRPPEAVQSGYLRGVT